MSNEVLLFAQIASVVVFLIALFSIYQTLATQKDATIQVQKEQIELLKLQLQQALAQTPDIAVDALSKRVKNISEELSRLHKDNEASAEKIREKEHELAAANREMELVRGQIARAEDLLAEFSCPKCKAPMISREFAYESVEYNGREVDVDHEHVSYECGYELADGIEVGRCGNVPR
jgi:DNA repair exonuclease SbcCD ATPase subunit